MQQFDVIVVGKGKAVLRAALSARSQGARVAMLEAASVEESGGNSRFAGGVMRFAFNSVEDLKLRRISMQAANVFSITPVLAALSASAVARAADAARDYPNRPIRLIVANAPGSSGDTLTRIVASRLGEALGQQIVVDNRTGAGGAVSLKAE